MKYIRTKDGIYEVVIEDDEIQLYQVKRHKDSIDYKEVTKQADTIEALCDEFVVMREGTKPHTAGVPYFKIKMDSKYINEKGMKSAVLSGLTKVLSMSRRWMGTGSWSCYEKETQRLD